MSKLEFNSNPRPTIGVEVELQIVDVETLELSNSIEQILERLPEDLSGKVKPELMQSYLEINTGICNTVRDVKDDLTHTLTELHKIVRPLGLSLFWGGTHPFSSWRNQKITYNERYHRLVDLMQDVARRLVTFGLHVHVGVDSGDKAVMICDRMLRHLPTLLAISSNSPFWEGRSTGLHSNRSMVMETLPTAGLPHQMRNWSEYVWLVNHLIDTGFINTIREIWWDIRPHYNFGTVEIRVCDVPVNLRHTLAITALVQCLVHSISNEIDEGTYQSEYHPMMVQQNKWRAMRYGSEARLVSSENYAQWSLAETTERLVNLLQPAAQVLDCEAELATASEICVETGAVQQLAVYEETKSRKQVVQQMLDRDPFHS